LGPVLDSLIDPAKSEFIRGRNILDSVAATHEVIFRSKIAQKEGFLPKLDSEKAYDIIVDCLKIIEDKSSENRVYTPDASLIIATHVMPRRRA